jgi:uncharacterized damage-inducible protein DinB
MNAILLNCVLLSICACTSATAQGGGGAESPQGELTVAALLDSELSSLANQFVEAADAMPEEKYGFKPTDGEFEGVLTFGQQVKHVAFYNYATFAIMLGETPPAEKDAARGPDAVRSKADILKYVRESFAAGHRAVAAMSMQNATARMENLPEAAHGVTRLQMMMFVLRHASSHYGQMVEYLRMNRIIPPASRPARQ